MHCHPQVEQDASKVLGFRLKGETVPVRQVRGFGG
jgi:hypothetical protein